MARHVDEGQDYIIWDGETQSSKTILNLAIFGFTFHYFAK